MYESIITYKASSKEFEQHDVVFDPETQIKHIEKPSFLGIRKCINAYLRSRELSSLLKKDGLFDNLGDDYHFRIVFHGAQDVYAGDWNAFQNTMKKSYWQNNEDKLSDDYKKYGQLPIIHLSTYNIFEHEFDKLPTKRYKKIIDSSIWNYYVPLDVKDIDENGEVRRDKNGKPIWKYDNNYMLFVEALIDIIYNSDAHLYDLAIAHEYADLNARLLEQSHLEGSHKIISPFLFHSESEMKKKIDEYEEKEDSDIPLATLRKFQWRFLLLDDKSLDKMSKFDDDDSKVDITKLQIITHDLSLLGFDETKIWFRTIDFSSVRLNDGVILDNNGKVIEFKDDKKVEPHIQYGKVINGGFKNDKYTHTLDLETPSKSEDIQIVIDCVKHVDAAQYCLQKYQYEIVLLDYLLDFDKIEGEHNREYGFQLLERLQEWNKKNKNEYPNLYIPGPHNRFFLLFISAFTTAVQERMLEKGFFKNETGLWFLGDGACPTNTPYLFSYLLMQLMRHRIRDLASEEEDAFYSIIELLGRIYIRKNPNKPLVQEVRSSANRYFNVFLFMRAKYEKLRKDIIIDDENKMESARENAKRIMEMRSSLLVYSVFKVVHYFSNDFFDHLQHLVYLTAFGTVRQSGEMMREYSSINKTLCDYDRIVDGGQSTKGRNVSKAIHEYIIRLENH